MGWEGLPNRGKQGELGLNGMVAHGVFGKCQVVCVGYWSGVALEDAGRVVWVRLGMAP